MPINPYCIHQIYMLELSPTSTQYTHGAIIKLFCRQMTLVAISPVVSGKVGEWQEPSKLWW
jgi:hypothetical protein